MHSTISMGQVGLAFSRRQQCLFKINLKTLKYGLLKGSGISSQMFFAYTDRQKTDYFRACALRLNYPLSRTSIIVRNFKA